MNNGFKGRRRDEEQAVKLKKRQDARKIIEDREIAKLYDIDLKDIQSSEIR